MKLPKSLTTVTLLSRLVALGLLVVLPFLGFYVGIKYQALQQTTTLLNGRLEGKIKLALEQYNPEIKKYPLTLKISGKTDNFVRFYITPDAGVGLDSGFGFAQLQNGEWKIINFGTGGDPTDFYKKYNVPKELRDKAF